VTIPVGLTFALLWYLIPAQRLIADR
jgi:hypothetical protein